MDSLRIHDMIKTYSQFFGYVLGIDCIYNKINLKHGGSNIDSSKRMKSKKATIDQENNNAN